MKKKKGKTRFELILFYNAGFKPRDAIACGVPTATAYAYSGHFKRAKENFKQMLKDLKG